MRNTGINNFAMQAPLLQLNQCCPVAHGGPIETSLSLSTKSGSKPTSTKGDPPSSRHHFGDSLSLMHTLHSITLFSEGLFVVSHMYTLSSSTEPGAALIRGVNNYTQVQILLFATLGSWEDHSSFLSFSINIYKTGRVESPSQSCYKLLNHENSLLVMSNSM